ncbi:hypothetical protein Asp14428_03090 [Actinoplanes sp. NBRC 14428]|nr:hypothetical protein Asp14428_03090 [Actinoplanes sp. NBRC 14428]
MRIDGTAGVEPGFSHGDGTVRDPGARMSSTTRYLSGAAYVDEKFADDVIRELVADSHRAVAPAVGYDVTTVIRHCFRAQRLWLAQNAVITAILLVGLAFFTSATVTVLAVCVAAAVFTSEHPEPGKRPSWKAVATGVAALLLIGCVLEPLLGLVQALGDPFAGGGSFDGSFGEGGNGGTGTDLTGTVLVFLLKVVLVAGAAYATVVWSRQRMIGIITADLGRGGPRAAPPANRREVEQRLRVIDEAQHGNILLHSGYEPFVGAGRRANAWSIATELRPEQDDEHPGDRVDGGSRPRPLTGRVPIDPVELVTHLRRRLAALRSRDLPPQERIGGLQLRDLVVSSGARWHDYPLIDERAKLPYTFAPRRRSTRSSASRRPAPGTSCGPPSAPRRWPPSPTTGAPSCPPSTRASSAPRTCTWRSRAACSTSSWSPPCSARSSSATSTSTSTTGAPTRSRRPRARRCAGSSARPRSRRCG